MNESSYLKKKQQKKNIYSYLTTCYGMSARQVRFCYHL